MTWNLSPAKPCSKVDLPPAGLLLRNLVAGRGGSSKYKNLLRQIAKRFPVLSKVQCLLLYRDGRELGDAEHVINGLFELHLRLSVSNSES